MEWWRKYIVVAMCIITAGCNSSSASVPNARLAPTAHQSLLDNPKAKISDRYAREMARNFGSHLMQRGQHTLSFTIGKVATVQDLIGSLQQSIYDFETYSLESTNTDARDALQAQLSADASFIANHPNWAQDAGDPNYWAPDAALFDYSNIDPNTGAYINTGPSKTWTICNFRCYQGDYSVDLQLLKLAIDQANLYNSQVTEVLRAPLTMGTLSTPGDYATAANVIGTIAVYITLAIVAGSVTTAVGPAILAGIAIGGLVYGMAAITNAPPNEFFSDVADAQSGALAVTGLGAALALIPDVQKGMVTQDLTEATAALRGAGQKVVGAVILQDVFALIVGTGVYLSSPRRGANRAYDSTPLGPQTVGGFYVDGSYQTCVSFNDGDPQCWKHYL